MSQSISLHKALGPWIAYRAVIVFSGVIAPRLPRPPEPTNPLSPAEAQRVLAPSNRGGWRLAVIRKELALQPCHQLRVLGGGPERRHRVRRRRADRSLLHQ